jgi:hypothetical protein
MPEVEISSQNFNGKTVDVTFYSVENPSIGVNIGTFTIPFVYSAQNILGTYEIYIVELNRTCELVVSEDEQQFYLLLENGTNVLLENGQPILLESFIP